MNHYVKLNSKKIFIILASISLIFTIINLGLIMFYPGFSAWTSGTPVALFNMDSEVSIPTWYAQTLLFVASCLFFVIALSAKHSTRYWYALSAIFIFVSIDEGASVHELLMDPVRNILNITSGPLYYSWFIVYLGLFLILVALFFRFFLTLPLRLKKLMVLSALIFLSGAVGLEIVGGMIASSPNMSNSLYAIVTTIEETLELLGASVLVYALLDYLKSFKSRFELKFD
jgi:hypothetical protein